MDDIKNDGTTHPVADTATHFDNYGYTGTYSPEDNKLRLYAATRLPADVYARVKAAGFRWAPKQELFVAPMWTPAREDLLTELCGDIGDEDTSLVDRQAERAERFEVYSDKREADAERAHAAVHAIADGIPLGQPILVGHHSERHARKDAERIENGMRKAVKMWQTSKYWTARAAGALAHAKYKELPRVRANRIKTLEADKRKQEREHAHALKMLDVYTNPKAEAAKLKDGRPLRLALLGSYGSHSLCFDDMHALDKGTLSYDDALARAIRNHTRARERCERWLAHLANRLTYERAMLDEQGASDLLKPPPRRELLPLCNYRAPAGLDCPNQYHKGEMIHYPQVEMTAAEYARINKDYKGTRIVDRSHRIRTALQRSSLVCVFLTDSKVHERPAAVPPTPPPDAPPPRPRPRPVYKPPERTKFDDMREQLRAGVKIAVAPQLFVTPDALARRVIEAARIWPGARILEPSAGTGALLRAIGCPEANNHVVAIEHSVSLADELRRRYSPRVEVICGDFLELSAIGHDFDVIVMNPPFEKGADVEHVTRALTLLNPDGGHLVAIMSAGITFREDSRTRALRTLIEERGGIIEPLPDDSFAASGTSVRTVLVTI